MHRREWLAAVACAVMTFRGRRAGAASGPELPPVTIEQALDRLGSLMSAEALVAVFAASEDELVEFERGIRDIMERRWFRPPGVHPPSLAKALASLAGAFDRRKVDPIDRAAYLLSTLWRRRKGLSLDKDQQLAIFHEHRRRLSEAVDSYRRALPPRTVVHDLGPESPIDVLDTAIHFKDRTSEIQANEELLDALAATLKSYSAALLFESQGHAAGGEPHALALSLSRARVAKEGLVRRGIEASRLTVHGLGARFTIPESAHCPAGAPWWVKVSQDDTPACTDLSAPARDRRVDFVILRRKPRWPSAVSPAPRDGGAGGDAR